MGTKEYREKISQYKIYIYIYTNMYKNMKQYKKILLRLKLFSNEFCDTSITSDKFYTK